MKLGKAGKRSQFVHGNVFGAVLGNVIADVHEFIYIFVLFARGNAGEHFLGIDIGASERHEKADHQGIDGRLRIWLGVVVFADDFFQIKPQLPIQIAMGITAHQQKRMDGLQQGVHALDIADQAVVKKKYQAFPRLWRSQLMERTGSGNPDVSFIQDMRLAVNHHRIFIFKGHDDFKCGMPVKRVILVFPVVPQAYAL